MTPAVRPLVAVSTKAYFSKNQNRLWMTKVASSPVLNRNGNVDVAVIPSFPFLAESRRILSDTQVLLGAQNVAMSESGAQTGEVRASVLSDMGCTFCEVGHAERRALFGESDQVIAKKVLSAVAEGMVPIICVGETENVSTSQAQKICVEQVKAACGATGLEELVVAYEPIWAIGATEAASPTHISAVAEALHEQLSGMPSLLRVIYGGTAGPGLISQLSHAVDGLFLGRLAHKVSGFEQVVNETEARVLR